MGTINLVGSLRYDMTGRKRKTKSLTTKSKRTIYKELVATQQRQYDKIFEHHRHRRDCRWSAARRADYGQG